MKTIPSGVLDAIDRLQAHVRAARPGIFNEALRTSWGDDVVLTSLTLSTETASCDITLSLHDNKGERFLDGHLTGTVFYGAEINHEDTLLVPPIYLFGADPGAALATDISSSWAELILSRVFPPLTETPTP